MCVVVQWQPLAAVLLTPYLVGNVVSSLLLTTSWLTQMTSPPNSRESTVTPMGGKRLPAPAKPISYCPAASTRLRDEDHKLPAQ